MNRKFMSKITLALIGELEAGRVGWWTRFDWILLKANLQLG